MSELSNEDLLNYELGDDIDGQDTEITNEDELLLSDEEGLMYSSLLDDEDDDLLSHNKNINILEDSLIVGETKKAKDSTTTTIIKDGRHENVVTTTTTIATINKSTQDDIKVSPTTTTTTTTTTPVQRSAAKCDEGFSEKDTVKVADSSSNIILAKESDVTTTNTKIIKLNRPVLKRNISGASSGSVKVITEKDKQQINIQSKNDEVSSTNKEIENNIKKSNAIIQNVIDSSSSETDTSKKIKSVPSIFDNKITTVVTELNEPNVNDAFNKDNLNHNEHLDADLEEESSERLNPKLCVERDTGAAFEQNKPYRSKYEKVNTDGNSSVKYPLNVYQHNNNQLQFQPNVQEIRPNIPSNISHQHMSHPQLMHPLNIPYRNRLPGDSVFQNNQQPPNMGFHHQQQQQQQQQQHHRHINPGQFNNPMIRGNLLNLQYPLRPPSVQMHPGPMEFNHFNANLNMQQQQLQQSQHNLQLRLPRHMPPQSRFDSFMRPRGPPPMMQYPQPTPQMSPHIPQMSPRFLNQNIQRPPYLPSTQQHPGNFVIQVPQRQQQQQPQQQSGLNFVSANAANQMPANTLSRKVLINPNFKGGVEAATNKLMMETLNQNSYLAANSEAELLRQQEAFINQNFKQIEKRRNERSSPPSSSSSLQPPPINTSTSTLLSRNERDRSYTPPLQTASRRGDRRSRERDHRRPMHTSTSQRGAGGTHSSSGVGDGHSGSDSYNTGRNRRSNMTNDYGDDRYGGATKRRRSNSRDRDFKDNYNSRAEEDDETRAYRLKIEKQKALREQVLRDKEMRRRKAISDDNQKQTKDTSAVATATTITAAASSGLAAATLSPTSLASSKTVDDKKFTPLVVTEKKIISLKKKNDDIPHKPFRAIPTAKIAPEAKRKIIEVTTGMKTMPPHGEATSIGSANLKQHLKSSTNSLSASISNNHNSNNTLIPNKSTMAIIKPVVKRIINNAPPLNTRGMIRTITTQTTTTTTPPRNSHFLNKEYEYHHGVYTGDDDDNDNDNDNDNGDDDHDNMVVENCQLTDDDIFNNDHHRIESITEISTMSSSKRRVIINTNNDKNKIILTTTNIRGGSGNGSDGSQQKMLKKSQIRKHFDRNDYLDFLDGHNNNDDDYDNVGESGTSSSDHQHHSHKKNYQYDKEIQKSSHLDTTKVSKGIFDRLDRKIIGTNELIRNNTNSSSNSSSSNQRIVIKTNND